MGTLSYPDKQAFSKMKKCQVEMTRLKDKISLGEIKESHSESQMSSSSSKLRERRKTTEMVDTHALPDNEVPQEDHLLTSRLKLRRKIKDKEESKNGDQDKEIKIEKKEKLKRKAVKEASEPVVDLNTNKANKSIDHVIKKQPNKVEKNNLDQENKETCQNETKLKTKKRKRRRNKTGFPTIKLKKKKIKLDNIFVERSEESTSNSNKDHYD